MTNPFAQNVPTQQAPHEQQPAAGNPFAQAPAAAVAAPAAPAPAQHQQQPATGNPFAHAATGRPVGMDPMQHVQHATTNPQAWAQNSPPQFQQGVASYPPQQQPAAAPQFGNLASAPAPVIGGSSGASLAHMYGRLVLVFPLREETVPRRPEHITAEQRANGNVTQQRLTATVVVLDGGSPDNMAPIGVDGKPNAFPPEPPTEYAPLPYVRKAMWINQSRLISQCRDYLPGTPNGGPGGTPGMVCGRVVKAGPQQNDPWYLEGANEREMQLVQAYLKLVQAGQYPNPLA